jgi:IstB-like ATP binding protein
MFLKAAFPADHNTADECSSVIVTTDLPSKKRKEGLGSERLTSAILDRLMHRCSIIAICRESCCPRNAPRSRSRVADSADVTVASTEEKPERTWRDVFRQLRATLPEAPSTSRGMVP